MATRRINGTGSQTGQRGELRCFSVRQDETRCSANLGNSLGLIGASGLLGLIDQPGLVAPSTTLPPELNTWLEGMIKLTANEPALQFWDASNEPDNAARNAAAPVGRN